MNRPTQLSPVVVAAFVVVAGAYGGAMPPRPVRSGAFTRAGVHALPDDTGGVATRRLLPSGTVGGEVSPSPDGNLFAYWISETGELGLWDLSTGQSHALTHSNRVPYDSGEVQSPLFSPDGKWVAYNWERWPDDHDYNGLRIVGVDASNPRVLYEVPGTQWVSPKDWSRDGRWIVAVLDRKSGSQIIRVSTETGSTRVVTDLTHGDPQHVAFSADGRWVYYDAPVSKGASQRDIYAHSVDGGPETTIVRSSADDRLFGISPDGRDLLFSQDSGSSVSAWLLPIRDGKAVGGPTLVKRELRGVEAIGFVRDGSYVYGVDVGHVDVYVAPIDPSTGALDRPAVVNTPGPGVRRLPTWSPDGRSIAYLRWSSNEPLRRSIVVHSMEAGAERVLPLLPAVASLERLRWTADGRSLLAEGNDTASRHVVMRVDAETGVAEPAVELPAASGWGGFLSMRGDSIVIAHSLRGGGANALFIAHLARRGERMIYQPPKGRSVSGHSLALSPSGGRVAFCEAGKGWRLRVIDLETGRVRTVPDGIHDSKFGGVWTDDSTLLVRAWPAGDSTFQGPLRLYRVHLENDRSELVPHQRKGLDDLRISPDRTRLAFVAGTPGEEIWEMSGLLSRHRDGSAP